MSKPNDSSTHSAHAHEQRQLRAYRRTQMIRPFLKSAPAILGVVVLVSVVTGICWISVLIPRAAAVRHLAFYVPNTDAYEGTIATVGVFGKKDTPFADASKVYDYASVNGVTAAIVSGVDGHGTDVLLRGASDRLLTNDGVGKAALAISPDGTTLAYAQIADTSSHTLYTRQLSAWTIKTIALSTGVVTERGMGYRPQFFTVAGEQYLFYTSPSGVTVMNLADGIPHATPVSDTTVTDSAAVVTKDGTHLLVQDQLSGNALVLTIQSVQPTLRIGGVLDTGRHYDSVISNGDTYFGLTRAATGGAVWNIDPANPTKAEIIHTFSPGFNPSRILPN